MENRFLLIIVFFAHAHSVGMLLPFVSPKLNLSGRSIKSIEEIEHLDDYKSVTKLDLSNNKIERFDIKALCKLMPQLKTFSFSRNQITELHACMFEGLPEDSSLDLSHNPIKKIGAGVERTLARLRDKGISISLHGTQLKAEVLTSLAKSLERSSWAHLLTGIGLMAGGGIVFVGSTVLMIVSDLDGDGQRNIAENVMFGSGIVGMLSTVGLCAARPIVSCIQHDAHQSRFYCYQGV